MKQPSLSHRLQSRYRAGLARMTAGVSPAQYANATVDWLGNLAISPGRQIELASHAARNAAQLTAFTAKAAIGKTPEAVTTPDRADRRFADEAWQSFPFNVMSQSYLTARELALQTATDVPGQHPDSALFVRFLLAQMIDTASPSNLPLLNPEVLRATRRERGRNLARGLRHFAGDVSRKLRGKQRGPAGDFKVGENLAVTPGKVVFRNELIELIQYEPATKQVEAEPLLFIPPWIMKYYILDLSPENSMVRYHVEQGRTVFMLSWKNPGKAYADYGIQEYLDQGVMAAIDAVSEITGEKINLTGYCAGGSLAAIAAGVMGRDGDDRLNSLTTFTAQTDFSEPGDIKIFLNEGELAFLKDMMEHAGYLDGKYFGNAFSALNINNLLWGPALRRYFLGKDEPVFDLMAWNADVTRVPAKLHYECLRSMFVRNEIAEGRFDISGGPLNLSVLRAPSFVVGTTTDHVAPWHSVYKMHRLAPNTDLTFCLTTGGHNVGIICGAENPKRRHQIATRAVGDAVISPEHWQAQTPVAEGSWWPAWSAWLAQRASKTVNARSISKRRKAHPPIADAPGEYVLET